MRRWEELIHENVFRLGGNQDHLPACLAYMLYCIVAEEQYKLADFFVKRTECAQSNLTANLPYGMFLTRLYRYIMEHYPHLDNGIYNVVDHVMRPLALKQTRKPQSDMEKPVTPSHLHPSIITMDLHLAKEMMMRMMSTHFLQSFDHLILIFFSSDPSLIPQVQETNAPSKTPSTKDTSSSSIDYIPKSPTSSTSPSTNGYLNSLTSPPPRVPPPPPTQESGSIDITLTLSPITPLDV
ncbi:hypothetical protein Tco_0413979 [Tanacetum coccineum]